MEEISLVVLNASTTSSPNLLCSSRHIARVQPLPVSAEVLLVINSLQFIYCFSILIFGTLLNAAVVIAVATNKSLQTLDMAIAFQIVVLNIFRILVDVMPSVISLIAKEWLFGSYMCSTLGYLSFTLFALRRTLVLTMAIDRYLLVFSPFGYPKYRSKGMTFATIITWVFTTLFYAVGVPGILDCYTLRDSRLSCSFNSFCSYTCLVFGYLSFALICIPAYGIPVFLYGALYWKSRKMISHLDQNESKLSIRRSNITFFLLFLTCFVLTTPSGGSIVAARIITQERGLSDGLRMTLFFLTEISLLLIVMDAIVIIRHRDVRDSLNQMFSTVKKYWKM